MRHRYISDLYKEFVGPRNGALEELKQDPKSEYLVGQIYPVGWDAEELEVDPLPLGNFVGATGEEDDDDSLNTVDQALLDAGKQFRSIPSSFGVSFALDRPPKPSEIRVCFTWGRYRNEANLWKRTPNVWQFELSKSFGSETIENPQKTVQGHYEIHQASLGQWKVSIFFLSIVSLEDRKRVRTEDVIFQPEIRVLIGDEVSLVPLGESGFVVSDDEWKVATRQYEKLSVHARGHLCGVYWKEIDPQRPPPEGVEKSYECPFVWCDGLHFSKVQTIDEKFFISDIRSDFVPMYPGPAAPVENKPAVVIPASKLASLQSKDELKKALFGVCAAYEEWIKAQNKAGDKVLEEIIGSHISALARIQEGVEFVSQDDCAFEAFVFMNKAMDKQYGWERARKGKPLVWRPFQLAFILFSLKSSVIREDQFRNVCDTIWFPTGGGKTEAYLGLSCFVIAYRRMASKKDSEGFSSGEGISIFSRYALRLLTIQQFRRALKMISASELLRCSELSEMKKWGRSPFSIGLWVGQGVTPNQMQGAAWGNNPGGATEQLKRLPGKESQNEAAQVLNCPCCDSILSLPPEGLQKGKLDFHFMATGRPYTRPEYAEELSNEHITVDSINIKAHKSGKVFHCKLSLVLIEGMKTSAFVKWLDERVSEKLGAGNCTFNSARPGYFPIYEGRSKKPSGFEIRCPNSECELNLKEFKHKRPLQGKNWGWAIQHELFSDKDGRVSFGIPISANTVDEEIYHNPPSLLISTCDKIVWTAYDERAASMFGRIRSFDEGSAKGFSQRSLAESNRLIPCEDFAPPDLIIQDELHLLEGPLGSNFGLFETAVDLLSCRPKYIASSATIRKAVDQISCLLGRKTSIFPPPNPDVSEGFFLKLNEIHPLDERGAGRLFLGLAFPGRAPQTPTVRTWGSLLQTSQNLLDEGLKKEDVDPFWTVVGYFNAVRELAQAETYWRQDISGFINYAYDRKDIRGGNKRNVIEPQFANLSSQTDSSDLPGILSRMDRPLTDEGCFDGVLTTSMFGTGVDVSRLSAMIIHGQPKASSQYIQAVGRIGRTRAGLAVNLYRVSKPRDLNHYEYFTGYHRRLPVAVEPITVRPLSSRALKKMVGPILVSIIRNWNDPSELLPEILSSEEGARSAHLIPKNTWDKIVRAFIQRWEDQPALRRYLKKDEFRAFVESYIDRWVIESKRCMGMGAEIRYRKGSNSVLGSNKEANSIFSDAPTSLRDVEALMQIYSKE